MRSLDDGSELPEDLGLELVPRSRALRVFARLVASLFVLTAAALWLVPWQQSIAGTGHVIAYAPLERQQPIQSPIAGQLVRWHVQEGDLVQEGQLVATIADNDVGLTGRLERTREAAERRIDAAGQSVRVYGEQVLALEAARISAVTAATKRIEMAVDRLRAAEQSRDAAAASLRTATLNLKRVRLLVSDGLSSTRDFELAELAEQTAAADAERATANARAARGEIAALEAERKQTDAATRADVDRARASLESARSDAASADAELLERETEVARNTTMQVHAPRAGTILRQLAAQGSQWVNAGDAIATLVPETTSRAVAMWVGGRDGPLVAPGRKVRLQFEGWPAVQFVGWPSVAVGTFPGTVAFVDAAADSRGRFRVVIVPDREAEPWPSSRLLRQGARANGWVLLDQVRMGFELWRQWNGFPAATSVPLLVNEEDATNGETAKGPP